MKAISGYKGYGCLYEQFTNTLGDLGYRLIIYRRGYEFIKLMTTTTYVSEANIDEVFRYNVDINLTTNKHTDLVDRTETLQKLPY